VRNGEDPFPDDLSLVIRWGCTGKVPIRNVLNMARAIHTVANKSGFRKLLKEEAPDTIPTTHFWDDELGGYEYPLVVRPRTHSQGRQLWLATTPQELAEATVRAGEGWYASSYIPKVAEYRVCFVQGRVAWVANKTPDDPSAVAWNVAQGGRFDNVRWGAWPLNVIETAYRAYELSGLDFSGVDVMVGPDGRSYVLEANSAPSMTSDYRKTCITKCFDHIVTNGKEHYSVREDRGWQGWVHPAVSGDAVV
jgi:glutathione synthase/RimK-type ligase-like ATP-grasp enzyme